MAAAYSQLRGLHNRGFGVRAVYQDRVAIAISRRGVNAEPKQAWLDLLPGREVKRAERIDARRPDFSTLLGDLSTQDSDARVCIEADLRQLVELFGIVADANFVGARLVVTGHSTCPKFHTDRVGVRLIAKWIGPGSEWLEH